MDGSGEKKECVACRKTACRRKKHNNKYRQSAPNMIWDGGFVCSFVEYVTKQWDEIINRIW